LFAALDKFEEHLADKEYLVGNLLSVADIRLFTTLVRFDPVYFVHFKCNIKALVDYQNLWDYTKRIYNHSGIAVTVDFDH
ncbi:glutathione S-transferase C-terminal domain-containing protein, partial [Streptococcus suis]